MNTVTTIRTPIGEQTLTASNEALTGVYFPGRHEVRGKPGTNEILERAAQQLSEYFERSRISFDLPLDAHGTEFERRVWALLREIPYGSTTSYGKLARQLGDPRDARAVGAANGKNPIPIIVPCHRVIGANGDHGIRRRHRSQTVAAGARGRAAPSRRIVLDATVCAERAGS